jgi:hypothetical protein
MKKIYQRSMNPVTKDSDSAASRRGSDMEFGMCRK